MAEIDHDRHSLITNRRPMRHESSAEGPKVTPEQISRFRDDGFLILDRFLDPASVGRASARFEPLFRGEFDTGLYPDEWNWKEGRDPPDVTRQMVAARFRPNRRPSASAVMQPRPMSTIFSQLVSSAGRCAPVRPI